MRKVKLLTQWNIRMDRVSEKMTTKIILTVRMREAAKIPKEAIGTIEDNPVARNAADVVRVVTSIAYREES
jgi:hypothetical protein